jgi:hypothetical protein
MNQIGALHLFVGNGIWPIPERELSASDSKRNVFSVRSSRNPHIRPDLVAYLCSADMIIVI